MKVGGIVPPQRAGNVLGVLHPPIRSMKVGGIVPPQPGGGLAADCVCGALNEGGGNSPPTTLLGQGEPFAVGVRSMKVGGIVPPQPARFFVVEAVA